MEQVGRPVHGGRELAAIEIAAMAALLHALDHEDILCKHLPPHLRVALAHRRHGGFGHRLVRIVDFHPLNRTVMGDGIDQHHEEMVLVDAEQHVGIKGGIFGARLPLLGNAVERGEPFAVFAELRIVDQRA